MNIRQIKDKFTCLDYLGKPVKRTKNGYLYHAPWREDNHPSLSVTANGKGWHDLATGDHGSIIDLVMRSINTTDVRVVCEEIQRHASGSFSFSQSISEDGQKKKEGVFTKFEVLKLQSKGLFAYLYHRKLNIGIAKQFLKEAHYSFKEEGGSHLYALAYCNDRGGYELRSGFYKGGTSPKCITTHLNLENAPLVVFEGFMDMLSFATLCGAVRHNYIVLNSIVNVDTAIGAIRISRNLFGSILLALDNDDGGTEATKKMMVAFPDAKDIRNRFAPYKDVNDYLCNLAPERS